MTIRILIADRHELFRDGLCRLLESEPEYSVIGQTDDGGQLPALFANLKPDVLLIGVDLCSRSVMEALREIASQTPVRPILLVDDQTTSDAIQALLGGARGFIFKDATTPLLLKAIRVVASGEYWISRLAVHDLVNHMHLLTARIEKQAQLRTDALSPQQMHIVEAIVSGSTNKQIAEDLSLSERTVKYHLTRIFHKTGVSGRMQLARYSLKNNLVREAG